MKEQISYNIMFDLFAESQDSYQHLEEYQYLCWQNERAALCQSIRAEALVAHSLPNRCIKRASTFQFEPFQISTSAENTQTDFHQYFENQTTAPMLSLDMEQTQPLSATNNNENFDSEWRPLEEASNGGNQAQIKQKEDGKMNISFNTTDYIIKHCFKKMLSQAFRDQVEPICEQEKLAYSQFCHYWKNKLEKYLPNKHIGLTRFKKMIDETKSKAVVVCRQFLAVYLWHEYPRYVAVGQMRNKQEYLRCATKLMYISCLPKRGSDIIYGARKQ